MPDEVWVTILSCLKPEQEDDLDHYNQSWFLSLPLVCKKFHRILEGNPQVCPNLRLDKRCTSQQWSRLLTWVRGRASHLTHLTANCGIPLPCLELVLAVMQPQSCLDRIYVEAPGNHTISRLAAFRTLTQCILLKPPSLLSLPAMEALPDLATVKLMQAHVADIEALAHLTALHLQSSETVCKHSFRSVTSLLSLDLEDAMIRHFHNHGVLACTRLLSLKCQHSILAAKIDGAYRLDLQPGAALMLAKNLVDLTALTRLVLCGSVIPYQHWSLQWVSHLTSLQHFAYNLPFDHLNLSEGVTALTKLTALHVWGYDRSIQILQPPRLGVDIDWAPFHSLKCVVFGGDIKFNAKLKDLAALRTLEHFRVYNMSGDRRTSQEWVGYARWLDVYGPHFLFEYTNALDEPYVELEFDACYESSRHLQLFDLWQS